MSNTNQLAAQVIANMSEEMKQCFLTASTEDQVALATQMALDALRKNEKMAVMFRANPEFRAFVERGTLAILAA
jgi:hypothetical protein